MTSIPQRVINDQWGTDDTGRSVSISEKYGDLRERITDLYDERVWFLTETALAVCVSCILEDISNPLALIFADGPSTEKTTVLDFFDGLPYTHRVDKFTPASFLTQSGNVRKKDLKNVDLLAKIPYKTVLIPEMGPTFKQPKEILLESYATLARVLDGTGLTNVGAVHGQRSLTGDYMFGLLGATTPINQTAWNTMGKVGSRLLFLNAPARLSRADRQQRAKNILTGDMHYKQKKRLAKEAVRDFLSFFFVQHMPQEYQLPEEVPENLSSRQSLLDHCGYLPRSVEWRPGGYVEETVDAMSLLADFVTTARQDLQVWNERGEKGRTETNSTGTVTEGVDRFTAVIKNLARAHALVAGRTKVCSEDLPLVIAVALSSLPDDRRKAIELLFDPSTPVKQSELGQFTLSEFQKLMKVSDKTAKTIMRKLELLELGTLEKGPGSSEAKFRLSQDFEWLLTDDFYRHYRPWDKRKGAGDTIDPPF
jgi:hypothetical protein